MRVEEVFAAAGTTLAVRDSWLRAECPGCGSAAGLDGIACAESDEETTYTCPKCAEPVVLVGRASGRIRGYRIGEWVVLPLGGMQVKVPPGLP